MVLLLVGLRISGGWGNGIPTLGSKVECWIQMIVWYKKDCEGAEHGEAILITKILNSRQPYFTRRPSLQG